MNMFNKEELINLYCNKKMSANEISKTKNCCPKTVRRYLKKFKIPIRSGARGNYPLVTKNKLKKLYCDKKISVSEIAEIIGAKTTKTVYDYLKKYNISSDRDNYIYIPKDLLEKLYCSQKLSTWDVAEELSVSKTTVINKLNEYNIKLRKSGPERAVIDYDLEILKNMYENQLLNCRQIVEKLDIDIHWVTLNNKLKEYGTNIRDNSESNIAFVSNLSEEEIQDRFSHPGKSNPNYNPNLSKKEREEQRNYLEYYIWSKEVKERDNYTCQICGQLGGKLVSHHIESYVDNREIRTSLSNGITLCEDCHKTFHKKYGYGYNNKKQLNNFFINKGGKYVPSRNS